MDELNDQIDLPTAVLKAIQFDLMTTQEMEKISSGTVIKGSDVTSAKLGLPTKAKQCETCGSRSGRDCDGHSGDIKLPATVFNPYFIKEVVQLLNQTCPGSHTQRKKRDTKLLKSGGGPTSQSSCKYCSNKLYPRVIFKALKSPRVMLSRNKIKRDPTVVDKMSIIAEVSHRVILPQDYWGFIPHEYDQLPESTVTEILLSPHQVSIS